VIDDSQSEVDEALRGLRVLVVEDEAMIAMLMEDMLIELGCEVVVAPNVGDALRLVANERFACAILDINVGGDPVDPVAHELVKRDVPFIFSSGYGADGVPVGYEAHAVLAKPFRQEELAPMLVQAIRKSGASQN